MPFSKGPTNKKVGFRPLVSFDAYNFYFSGYWSKRKEEPWAGHSYGCPRQRVFASDIRMGCYRHEDDRHRHPARRCARPEIAMKVTFWGAARTVTGSMHQLDMDGKVYLLDCGMYQGRRKQAEERNRHFPFSAKSIDAVILS